MKYFHYILTLPYCLPPSWLLLFFVFFKGLSSLTCVSKMLLSVSTFLECWSTCWQHTITKTNSPCPRRYNLPTDGQVGLSFLPTFPIHWVFVWLEFVQILYIHLQMLWVRMCSYPVVSSWHRFLAFIYYLCILQSFYPLFWNNLRVLRGEGMIMCPCRFQPSAFLLSAHWLFVHLCVNSHLLQEKPSLVRSETCANLRV